MHPFGWKPAARQQFSAGKMRFGSSRTVAGRSNSNRARARAVGITGPDSSSVQAKPEFAAAEQRDSFNSNRVCTRLFESPGPNSSSVQTGRFFAAVEQEQGSFQIRSGMHPLDWKPRATQQSSAGQAILRSSRTIVAKRQPFKPNRARLAGQHKRF